MWYFQLETTQADLKKQEQWSALKSWLGKSTFQ
jgi:hypothetical protein